MLGGSRLWEHPWPEADPALLEEDEVEVVVQVNGKLRDRLRVPADISEDELVARAGRPSACERTSTAASPSGPSSSPGKLVNFVV